jgi:hypothetical protein
LQAGGEGGLGSRFREGGGFVAKDLGGGVDGGDGGGWECREEDGRDSNFGVECGVTDSGWAVGAMVGPMRGTRPTGTVLRKWVRGTPRTSNSGRSLSRD